jgi:uncharacterized membrane protein YsdA (DUF1294 family)
MDITYLVWGWLAFINLFTLAAFRHDKQRSINGGRRMPERDLLTLAAIGGTLGAWLGMRIFRHKTQKAKFSMGIFLIAAAQCALIMLMDISA